MPTSSNDEIEDGVCRGVQAAQPTETAVSPEPTGKVVVINRPTVKVDLGRRTTTQKELRTLRLPEAGRGAGGAGRGVSEAKARARAMASLVGPQTDSLPQRRQPKLRHLLLEGCLLPLLLIEHRPRRNATGGETLLGETPEPTTAEEEMSKCLFGKVARPSHFGGRTTATIAARAAVDPPLQGSGGEGRLAAVGAETAGEDEADA